LTCLTDVNCLSVGMSWSAIVYVEPPLRHPPTRRTRATPFEIDRSRKPVAPERTTWRPLLRSAAVGPANRWCSVADAGVKAGTRRRVALVYGNRPRS
jgi:hypothetical protein